MTEEQKAERIHAILYSRDSREEIAERIVGLEDENAELRLLVKGLIWCDSSEYNKGACDSCPINHNCNPLIGRCEYMAKKLGIEVQQ